MTGKVFQYENHYEMKKNRLKVLVEMDYSYLVEFRPEDVEGIE